MPTLSDPLTVGEISRLFQVKDWRVRRTVDRLGCNNERAGRYRLVPRSLLGSIAASLKERGRLPSEEVNV